MLRCDADMMRVEYFRGFQLYVGHMIAGYRDGGNTPPI